MLRKTVSGIMLTLLLIDMLTFAFSVQPAEANGAIIAIVNPETGGNEFTFPSETPINSTFIANVTVMNCSFLAGWYLNITWDPTLLNVTSIDDLIIPSDNVFGAYAVDVRVTGCGMLFFAVEIDYFSPGAPEYVNVTYGTLCQIRFTIISNSTASCNLHFVTAAENLYYTLLVDYYGEEIPCELIDGSYSMLSLQHDIGMVSLTTSKTVIGQGYNLNITARILNYGAATETFDVTFYAGATRIGTMTVYDLAPDNYANVTFTWNTSGFARAYVISANATIFPGETETADNKLIDGTVKVSCRGDVNGDYRTDMLDYQRVKRALTSTPGSPKWNPNADFNNNLTIDDGDFQIVKIHIPSIAP